MNINDLTIGQVKELSSLFGNNNNVKISGLLNSAIGNYVIIRSRNEGINAGILIEADDTGCRLKNARRIYKPISKDRSLSWYEGAQIVTGKHSTRS